MTVIGQIGILVVVFLLAMILALQIQVTGLDRDVKELKKKLGDR